MWDLIDSIFFLYATTLSLVVINSFSSKLSPNLFFALAISLFIFDSIFSQYSSINTSALYLFLESLLSIKGSLNASTCPEAFHISGCINIALSRPTILSFI